MPIREQRGENRPGAPCREIEPLLAPYGDETPPADVLRQVEAHLAECPPCRDTAAACSAARRALRAHAAQLTSSAPGLLTARCRALAMRETQPRRARRWIGWSAVAGTAAVILFVILMPAQAVATQLALDHLKCTKLASSQYGGTPETLEAHWMERRGQQLTIPGDNPGAGLRLVGLRRCGSTEGTVAHLIYQQAGQAVSLFVLRDGAKAFDRQLVTVGHKAILWTENARTYVLVGRGDDLAGTARAMRQDIQRRRTRIE